MKQIISDGAVRSINMGGIPFRSWHSPCLCRTGLSALARGLHRQTTI